MRLLLTLEVSKDFSYDKKYFSKFNGFIYKQLVNTPYQFLHEKKGSKFFCFSNIFPLNMIGDKTGIKPFKEGEKKFWLVSSVDKGFISIIYEKMEKIKESGEPINLGEMQFYIRDLKTKNVKIKKNRVSIKAETPIILRIPRYIYESYGVNPPKKYKYLFWRRHWPFELFLEALTKNLLNKYREFYGINDKDLEKNKILPLFQRFELIKTVVNHIIIDGREHKLFGSLWKFGFDYITDEQKKILEFALDTGFGEKNSYGFGFVNLI